ncbi:MAG: TrkA C-terminal domain-containing protein [Micromonospora sp.]
MREARVRSKWGVTVVAVKPQAALPGGRPHTFTYATPDTVLAYRDLILVVGAVDNVERFATSE